MIAAVRDRLLEERVTSAEPSALEEDLQDHCFLIRPSSALVEANPEYRFAHKSFFEYLLASHVETELALNAIEPRDLVELLGAPLPDVVIRFIRESLVNLPHTEGRCRRIACNLTSVLDTRVPTSGVPSVHLPPDVTLPIDPRTEMARQQAGNLLPLVASQKYLRILEIRAEKERSPFVRRGIAVGLALHRKITGPLEAFV